MGNKMLIDASHPEETRVVVVRGNRVEEFDFESQSRKQLRGSIFLAKVIRVEPSLQAAFVDYGGNRHGFLAFAEIHPDYYRLPQAELEAARHERDARPAKAENYGEGRQSGADTAEAAGENDAALTETAGENAASGAEFAEAGQGGFAFPEASAVQDSTGDEVATESSEVDGAGKTPRSMSAAVSESTKISEIVDVDGGAAGGEPAGQSAEAAGDGEAGAAVEAAGAGTPASEAKPAAGDDDDDDDDADGMTPEEVREQQIVESLGGEDALEELPQRERPRRRLYKIQEVIKRNQILLVQVVKEERGNKGAALTTYLSLAGRYTVLMPNTASGGGISRKITVATDRKRLREIATELEVPQGMGLIIRTAGAARTKAEVKRDYEYLLRLWENVRDLTLQSKAPALVYEEGDLIKRSIRDLYNREIDEIQVAGEEAFKEAKDFMRMLMPSHAKNVQFYREPEPIFTRHGVEHQLNMMFNPRVTLRSGGYIVINQTEALVAIDVNSGKSTREHSIEETALKTNLEAAEEVSRQLRLRDLAGLIVIDFIDMEERRNNRSVERKLKDCLRNDRARIQVGRISPFGLLEMSRQRLRTGMVEGSTRPCHVCDGTGVIRSTESVALLVLRAIEDTLISKGPANLSACASVDAALYILNNKRVYLRDIEIRYGVTISITASENMHGSAYTIEKVAPASGRPQDVPKPAQMTWIQYDDLPVEEVEADAEEEAPEPSAAQPEEAAGEQRSPRNRRRRKRFRNGHDYGEDHGHGHTHGGAPAAGEPQPAWRTRADVPQPDIAEPAATEGGEAGEARAGEGAAAEDGQRSRRSRRRGRRGGQRQRESRDDTTAETSVPAGMGEQPQVEAAEGAVTAVTPLPQPEAASDVPLEPAAAPEATAEVAVLTVQPEPVAPNPAEAPQPEIAAPPEHDAEALAREVALAAQAEEARRRAEARKARPARGGWWQRRLGG